MSEKILVPILGESITEATVAKWLKKKGESVNVDEPIIELETDKVNLEVPSPISGVISEINYKNGDIVKVGAELGAISKSVGANEKISETKKETPKIEEDTELDITLFTPPMITLSLLPSIIRFELPPPIKLLLDPVKM